MDVDAWLRCVDPRRMLEALGGCPSERKLRLFACACCRHMDRRGNSSGLSVVGLAEQVADGVLPLAEAVRQESSVVRLFADTWALDPAPPALAGRFTSENRAWHTAPRAALLRCLFRPPSSDVSLDPHWLAWEGATIPRLAEGIYQDRAFEQLPILADALEEAGCADRALLEHLRAPGPHARGCWPLDLVLGKS
jgi:hypothetical protein